VKLFCICLWTAAPSWYVISYPCLLSPHPPPWIGEMSTSEAWGANKHTVRYTSPITVVSQFSWCLAESCMLGLERKDFLFTVPVYSLGSGKGKCVAVCETSPSSSSCCSFLCLALGIKSKQLQLAYPHSTQQTSDKYEDPNRPTVSVLRRRGGNLLSLRREMSCQNVG